MLLMMSYKWYNRNTLIPKDFYGRRKAVGSLILWHSCFVWQCCLPHSEIASLPGGILTQLKEFYSCLMLNWRNLSKHTMIQPPTRVALITMTVSSVKNPNIYFSYTTCLFITRLVSIWLSEWILLWNETYY